MSKYAPPSSTPTLPAATRIAIVASKWNAEIVDALIDGCVERLKTFGMVEGAMQVERVPGAYELPVAAKWFAESRRFHAVICFGCVVRGETYHFELVANEAGRGIQDVALSTGVPCIFGVLAVENLEQAKTRVGGGHGHAGVAAADAAADMIGLKIRTQG